MKLSDVQAGRIAEYLLAVNFNRLLQVLAALPPGTRPLGGAGLLIRTR